MLKLRKHLLLWLLPLLAMRALVPAGFMIDTSHGAMSVIVCPGHQHQTDENQAGHSSNQGKSGSHDTVTLCPFAAAATAGPMADLPTMAVGSALVVDQVSDDVSALDLPFGPARAQQSRAPPLFS